MKRRWCQAGNCENPVRDGDYFCYEHGMNPIDRPNGMRDANLVTAQLGHAPSRANMSEIHVLDRGDIANGWVVGMGRSIGSARVLEHPWRQYDRRSMI